METYRSGHNELDSKSSCRLVPARGFESHRLRFLSENPHEYVFERMPLESVFMRVFVFLRGCACLRELPAAGRIAALKDMGFSLADIVRILEVYDDRDQLEQCFSARQRELEAISQDTAHKLTLLDAARKRLRKEEDMSYNVTIKTIPERYAATVHMTLPRYEDEGMIWGKLAEET